MHNTLELLSPAGNADIGIAAVDHGADAVYIGGPAFGARANAGNAVGDIARLAAHAHRFGARVFVTLNTVLREDELEPARRLCFELHDAGIDALIVQDMGLLELELPPLQLHASTQTDIRTPAKARFLQDAGFSQMVLARELSLGQIRDIADEVREACLEYFIHGALCVAYSGQCYISHAQTGRSANRGDCSQACRLPYTLTDAGGRIVAHDKHLLSMKDNDQTANLAALVDAGIRSFKIEGRYKDMAYVKNVTAHYRRHLDALLEGRPDLAPASSGRCRFTFTPDPSRNFHRGHTDYFVHGRSEEVGAFDSPKFAGTPLGHVVRVDAGHFDIEVDGGVGPLHNGDGLTYYDLQGELIGVQVNVAQDLGGGRWRAEPNDAVSSLPDLRAGLALNRNRDMSWVRALEGRTSERRIGLAWRVEDGGDGGGGDPWLHARDDDGHEAGVPLSAVLDGPAPVATNPERAGQLLSDALSRLGNTLFECHGIEARWAQPRHLPASVLNAWRRAAVDALEAVRLRSLPRLARARPVEPPVPYPETSLSYLGNVSNSRAAAFYARHGVQLVEAAYEAHERTDEVSLMITKHCIRWSLSLCPKQAKGVVGVQGTVRAEPMSIVHGGERLTLRFDCRPCEMHVVGRMRRSVLADVPAVPIVFSRTGGPAGAGRAGGG